MSLLPFVAFWTQVPIVTSSTTSLVEGTSSLPLTPTSTLIHGISGSIPYTKQFIIGNQAAFICPSTKGNILVLVWIARFPTIVTTFSSIDNTFRISFGATTFTVCPKWPLIPCITLLRIKSNNYWHMSMLLLLTTESISLHLLQKSSPQEPMR